MKIEFGYDAFIGYVNRLIRNAESSPAKPPANQVKADKPAPKGKAKIDAPQEPKAEAPPSFGGFNFDANPQRRGFDLMVKVLPLSERSDVPIPCLPNRSIP